MISAHTYKAICDDLTDNVRWSGKVKLAGILFARPTSSLAKEEIIPNLRYFHKRSANTTHFFCGGYGAYWSDGVYPDKTAVACIDDVAWYFSDIMFDQLREVIEGKTSWRYSGATDLILLNVVAGSNSRIDLDFANTFFFPLGRMKADRIIYSTEEFFEDIFRFADSYQGDDAVTDFTRPSDIGEVKLAPSNIAVLWHRAEDCWTNQDYAGVLHACASVLETMAKHIVQSPSIQDKTLGSFFEKYRKSSTLPKQYLYEIYDIYSKRNTTPTAGHGSTLAPNIPMKDARRFMDFTSECVRLEYKTYALHVGPGTT